MKILLAVDDSKFSQAALRLLLTQYQPRKTRVRVLHVVEPLETPYYPELTIPYPTSLEDISKKRLKSGRDLATRVTAKLHASGFAVDNSVLVGHPRPAIIDVASKWHAELIIVGSHGRRGLERLLLGSVADYVAHHASCSVLIVRTRKRRGVS